MTLSSPRRVVILGLARQGVALARYWVARGAQVVISDRQSAEQLATNLAAVSDLPIEYVLGAHPETLLDGADLLCLSGGVDVNLPLAQAALRRGIGLSNDSQIFLEACPAEALTVGITGSAGKTTTTTLTGRMLSAPARAAYVGGNIGHPLIAEVGYLRAGDFAVLELSSFQLEIMTRSPRVAAVLNITPNHLDRHGTMEVYTAAKSHIVRYQTAPDVAVLGWDNALARGLGSLTPGRVAHFSGVEEVARGAFLRGDQLIWRWDEREHIIGPTNLIELRGRHNVLNALAACAISGAALALNGADRVTIPDQLRAGIVGFRGVAHRLELVREQRGVKWYNDSIASAPERVIAALHSFAEPLIILLGGRDKKLPWDELAQLARERVKHAVLFGEAGPLIQTALEAAQMDRFTRCEHLRDAVQVAAQRAQAGDAVLLSPGCASFDAFKDFADRGEQFRLWVQELV
jgi:UDP-N-acetylmuramoylalanine--D-glutamate ligase